MMHIEMLLSWQDELPQGIGGRVPRSVETMPLRATGTNLGAEAAS
jgi:hypothetical protein